jgi:hypothetical protein
MTQGVPGLIWSLLIIFASGLVGCMLVFAAEASLSKAVLVGVFTSSLTLALLTVRMLDFPFESALQLSSRDFQRDARQGRPADCGRRAAWLESAGVGRRRPHWRASDCR